MDKTARGVAEGWFRVENDTTTQADSVGTETLEEELRVLEVELETEFGRDRAMRAAAQARRNVGLYKPELGTLKHWLWGIARRTRAGSTASLASSEQQATADEDQQVENLDARIGLDRLADQVERATAPLATLMAEHPLSSRAKVVALLVGEISRLMADSARLTENDDLKAAAVVVDGVARILSDGLLALRKPEHRKSELEKLGALAAACEAIPLASRGYTRSRTRALSALARHLQDLVEAPDAAAETAIRHLAIEVPTLPKASVRDSSRLVGALAGKLSSYLQRHPLTDGADAAAEHEWRERFGFEALKEGLAVLGADGERRSELLAGLRQRRWREAERDKKHLVSLIRQIEVAAGDGATEAEQWSALERVLFGPEHPGAAEETS